MLRGERMGGLVVEIVRMVLADRLVSAIYWKRKDAGQA
jgi:hypothetical protein